MKKFFTILKVSASCKGLYSIPAACMLICGISTLKAENTIVSGTTLRVSSGTTLVNVGTMTIKNGATVTNLGTVNLSGTLDNQNVANTALGSGTFVLNGASPQSVNGQNTFGNLSINNSSGVSLNGSTTVNGILNLISGQVALGANNLLLGTSATVSGTPSASAMVVATGSGEFRKSYSGTGSFTFPVGDNSGTAEYSPVILAFTAGTFGSGNYVGVNVTNSAYPGYSGSYINRFWGITQSEISGFACNATLKYLPADVVGTESLLNCARIIPSAVNYYNPANTTLHQLTANGLTAFGTFTGTQTLLVKNLNIKLLLSGLMAGRDGIFPATGTMYESVNGNTGLPQWGSGVADHVTIEIYNGAPTYSLVHRFVDVNLLTNGNVAIATSPPFSGNYFIRVLPRTHLAVWSANTVSFAGSTINYDFSNNWTKAYQYPGNDLLPEKQMGTGIYALYLGDQDHGTFIDVDDMGRVVPDVASGLVGYIESDIDGAGWVDIDDMGLLVPNVIAGQYEQIPSLGGGKAFWLPRK